MPGYRDSPLCQDLNELRTQAATAVCEVKKDGCLIDIEMAEFIEGALGLLHNVCEISESKDITSPGFLSALPSILIRAHQLFSKEKLHALFLSTIEQKMCLAVNKKLEEHFNYTTDHILSNLQKNREKLISKLVQELGSQSRDKAEACFEQLLTKIQKEWQPGKENVEVLTDSILEAFETESALTKENVWIRHPKLIALFFNILNKVKQLPASLNKIIPFFNSALPTLAAKSPLLEIINRLFFKPLIELDSIFCVQDDGYCYGFNLRNQQQEAWTKYFDLEAAFNDARGKFEDFGEVLQAPDGAPPAKVRFFSPPTPSDSEAAYDEEALPLPEEDTDDDKTLLPPKQ